MLWVNLWKDINTIFMFCLDDFLWQCNRDDHFNKLL